MTKFSDFVNDAPRVAGVSIPVLDPNEVLDADKNKRILLENFLDADVLANYATAQTYINDALLLPGFLYRINSLPGAGDAIILKAISSTEFSKTGVGMFNVPDFHDVGVYDGVEDVTTIAAGARLGVWTPTTDGTIATGEIVIWNGFHYQCVASASVNGSNPYTNSTAYTLLPKTATDVGYIVEYDEIIWDWDLQSLEYRRDKRNNTVENNIYPGVHHAFSFQWGNDNVYNNKVVFPAAVNMANFTGYFYNNTILAGTVTVNYGNTGEIHSNLLSVTQLSFLNEPGDFTSNIILAKQNFTDIPISENFSQCYKDPASSSFGMELDLDTYSSGNDIQSMGNGICLLMGWYTLVGADASTLTTLSSSYIACTHPIQFYVESGNTQTFSPSAIGGASFYSLIGTAGNKTLTGRSNGNDHITIKPNGSFFEIINVNNIA